MRIVGLAIAILCAALSGWTPALARASEPAGAHERLGAQEDAGHRDRVHAGDTKRQAGAALPQASSDCAGDCPGGCRHPPKCVHPMSCAACFALQVRAEDLGRRPLPVSPLRPPADLPLTALWPQPAAPPPKPSI